MTTQPSPHADVYTHGHSPGVLRSHQARTVENSAAYLEPHLQPGQRLLDVGCGPGSITAGLAGRVADVTAVDNAPAVVAEAVRHAHEQGVGNARFAVGDIYGLDFADGAFDVVHAHQVLQHLTDPVAALVEMRRVCAPGGIVAARDADYAGMIWAPADPRLDRWMALYQEVARGNGAEPDAGRYLLGWAQRAGFASVEASASVWCYATDEARRWWGGVWAERILTSSVADLALERGLTERAELESISAAWRDWADRPDGWFVIPHGEILARP
ncbi:MAG: methyltransferase domain-containing protein [Acidimicrobiales bacterium]